MRRTRERPRKRAGEPSPAPAGPEIRTTPHPDDNVPGGEGATDINVSREVRPRPGWSPPGIPVGLPAPFFETPDRAIRLYRGDCLEILAAVASASDGARGGPFDMIFADPPYFLSDGGVTCRSGRMASVDKGEWDRPKRVGHEEVEREHEFNKRWLGLCKKVLAPDGTIWVSGTHHVIFSVGFAMQELGFKILNDVAWEKPNPPPNLSCRYFTHSTETLIWAARDSKSRHFFDYKRMREMADGRQMKSVWRILPPAQREKRMGRHPTQKPVELLTRCVLASTREGDLVLDPFLGSGTTAVACARLGRRCVGVEKNARWLDLAARRVKQALAGGEGEPDAG